MRSSLITVAALAISLVACAESESITGSLHKIQSIISVANARNAVHYQFLYDNDYPCKVSLEESWMVEDVNWFHHYRFDLTDIEPDTFVQSKDGRRAIIYDGHKVGVDGVKKTFSEKQINNVSYRALLSDEDRMLILKEVNTAIALCEEEYSF